MNTCTNMGEGGTPLRGAHHVHSIALRNFSVVQKAHFSPVYLVISRQFPRFQKGVFMSPIPKEPDRCLFYYADGRRCRMAKMEGHPELCPNHWARSERQNDSVHFAEKLLGRRQRLNSARAINRFLN